MKPGALKIAICALLVTVFALTVIAMQISPEPTEPNFLTTVPSVTPSPIAPSSPTSPTVSAPTRALAEDFNVTDGRIETRSDNRLQIRTKELRATLKSNFSPKVTLNFVYLGPTSEVTRFRDGTVRSQFGIELRALNVCNLIYVMWHFAPDSNVQVSTKINPSQTTHEECLDHGYNHRIQPSIYNLAPTVRVDVPHTLTAGIEGRELKVLADGVIVWQGELPQAALSLVGPAGLRSDNAHVIFDFIPAP